uniref:Uncharacterized protein n=1 Tax=Physcomitrium patens TaxID=3218 RepID=A0A2K1JEE6_PHYPA|nr:hypothetical protein PHYPA_020182 [Physcomitrium patens]
MGLKSDSLRSPFPRCCERENPAAFIAFVPPIEHPRSSGGHGSQNHNNKNTQGLLCHKAKGTTILSALKLGQENYTNNSTSCINGRDLSALAKYLLLAVYSQSQVLPPTLQKLASL